MKLTKELFEDVIVYRISELGAMGPAYTLECLKMNGEHFVLNYISDKTPWEEIKKNFPGINGCKFNGPVREEESEVSTRVNSGWKHMWLGYGNHLVCKEELYSELKEIFKDMDNCDITFDLVEKLHEVGFTDHLNEMEERRK